MAYARPVADQLLTIELRDHTSIVIRVSSTTLTAQIRYAHLLVALVNGLVSDCSAGCFYNDIPFLNASLKYMSWHFLKFFWDFKIVQAYHLIMGFQRLTLIWVGSRQLTIDVIRLKRVTKRFFLIIGAINAMLNSLSSVYGHYNRTNKRPVEVSFARNF